MERLTREQNQQDPYRSQRKTAGNPTCPSCSAVMVKGSWISREQAKARRRPVLSTSKSKCPACRQLEDRYAQGVVELRGQEWKKNSGEVLRTIEKAELIERNRNDQERILWIENGRGSTRIYTTLPELARHIARTLEKSFKGRAEYERSTEEPFLFVRWWSDSSSNGHEPGAPLAEKRRGRKSPASQDRSRGFRRRGNE
jgi:NMD protein affecting ribosome stability and mRNA decay